MEYITNGDDNEGDCISGNYYKCERGGTLVSMVLRNPTSGGISIIPRRGKNQTLPFDMEQ